MFGKQMAINSDKEEVAVRFNLKEERYLKKNLQTIELEKTYSASLFDLNKRIVNMQYRRLKDRVSKIKSHLNAKEISDCRKQETEGKITPLYGSIRSNSASRIAAHARHLKLDGYTSQPGTSRQRPYTATPGRSKNHMHDEGHRVRPKSAVTKIQDKASRDQNTNDLDSGSKVFNKNRNKLIGFTSENTSYIKREEEKSKVLKALEARNCSSSEVLNSKHDNKTPTVTDTSKDIGTTPSHKNDDSFQINNSNVDVIKSQKGGMTNNDLQSLTKTQENMAKSLNEVETGNGNDERKISSYDNNEESNKKVHDKDDLNIKSIKNHGDNITDAKILSMILGNEDSNKMDSDIVDGHKNNVTTNDRISSVLKSGEKSDPHIDEAGDNMKNRKLSEIQKGHPDKNDIHDNMFVTKEIGEQSDDSRPISRSNNIISKSKQNNKNVIYASKSQNKTVKAQLQKNNSKENTSEIKGITRQTDKTHHGLRRSKSVTSKSEQTDKNITHTSEFPSKLENEKSQKGNKSRRLSRSKSAVTKTDSKGPVPGYEQNTKLKLLLSIPINQSEEEPDDYLKAKPQVCGNEADSDRNEFGTDGTEVRNKQSKTSIFLRRPASSIGVREHKSNLHEKLTRPQSYRPRLNSREFSSHTLVEKEAARERSPSPTLLETRRMSFRHKSEHDDSVGEDIKEELREELLLEEHEKAAEIDMKVEDYMKRLTYYLKENSSNPELYYTRNTDKPKPITSVWELQRRRSQVFRFGKKPKKLTRDEKVWKDIKKCTYLRISEHMIDFSGIKTLATDQEDRFRILRAGMKYRKYDDSS